MYFFKKKKIGENGDNIYVLCTLPPYNFALEENGEMILSTMGFMGKLIKVYFSTFTSF